MMPTAMHATKGVELALRNNAATWRIVTVRWPTTPRCQSTATDTKSCPFSKVETERPAEKANGHPMLVEVPSLPFVGSTISRHSGAPPMISGREFDFWPEMRRRFGDFYSMGMPGLGVGLHGTAHIITDPKEMAKVIRSEGKYPSGIAQMQWGTKKHMRAVDSPISRGYQEGFFGRGTDWKRLRSFLQTDLLSPRAAAGYIPGVIHAAELASSGAPAFADSLNLNSYTNHCAFDMFCTVMFGELVQTADPATPAKEEDLLFVHMAKEQLATSNELNKDPFEILMGKIGIETPQFKKMGRAFDETSRIASEKVRRFIEKKSAGELDEYQERSWLAHAIERQAAQDSDVSEEEMIALAGAALGAAVDTTAGLLSWNLLQVALHPEVQERLHNELTRAVETAGRGGRRGLTAEVLQKSTSPYLHAITRESHRLTPNAPLSVFKRVAEDIEIHGKTFPEGTFFVFERHSTGQDPAIVENPEDFRPERWLPDAVEARKGTTSEIIDTTFFKEPFSQGARKCPGSRVATNETHALLAQLVLDWKISAPGVDSYKDVPYSLKGSIAPDLPKMEFVPR